MPLSRQQLLNEALSLNPTEREALAEELLLSLSESERNEVDAAWLAEVRARDAAYVDGKVKASPVDQAVNELLSRAKR
jgi:putative addiction module component (TIGR02574 family)